MIKRDDGHYWAGWDSAGNLVWEEDKATARDMVKDYFNRHPQTNIEKVFKKLNNSTTYRGRVKKLKI